MLITKLKQIKLPQRKSITIGSLLAEGVNGDDNTDGWNEKENQIMSIDFSMFFEFWNFGTPALNNIQHHISKYNRNLK